MMEKILLREDQYQIIAEHATDMISCHSFEGNYIYVSPSCTRILGYRPDELIGKNAYEFFHPEDLDQIIDSHMNILHTNNISTVSYRIRKKDGTFTWFETTSKTIRNKNTGDIEEIIAISRDITERINLENGLKESSRKFSAAFYASPAAILITRLESGLILDVNDRFCLLTGHRRDDVIGKTTLDIGLWADPQERATVINLLKEKGVLTEIEINIRTKDGTVKPTLSSGAIITVDGQPALLGLIQDLTPQKLSQEALQKLNAVFEERVKQRLSDLRKKNMELLQEIKKRGKTEKKLYSVTGTLKKVHASLDDLKKVIKKTKDKKFSSCCAKLERSSDTLHDVINSLGKISGV